jgi:glycosyltransferase involved in cell wall biosynthesis
MLELSVVICTHNPRADYLRRVLEALRAQTLPLDRWELIVVDNASECSIAGDYDLSWHPRAQHVREERLGLAYARERGMVEAAGELLVFVDDDNILDPAYLAEALRIGREWPWLGVWGGSIVPEFEIDPPPHLRKYTGMLALREISVPRWSNVATCADAEPWGAGLCMRATIGAAYRRHCREAAIRLKGRAGKSLMGGEDTEICYVACSTGLGMGLFPELRVTHLIPRERLSERYLLRLAEGMQTSIAMLGYKWRNVMPRSPLSPMEALRIAKSVAERRGIDRRMYLASVRGKVRARAIIHEMMAS